VACECCQWLRWDCGGEVGAADPMLPSKSAGVKPGVAHGVLRTRRCVPEHARDELVSIEAQCLALVIAVVGVAEANGVVGEGERPIARQRAALDVAGQVQRDTVTMGVGLADLDVPVQPVVACDGATPMELVLLRRQAQQPGIQGAPQLGEELAAEQELKRLDGDEEVRTRGAPLTLGIDAAGAGQAVHVRVVVERSPPGVQCHQQAGYGAQVARHGTQLEHALAHAVEEPLVQPRAVELPQRDEGVRQGEDQVEMRAGQQLLELGLSPLTLWSLGAARAAAMAAGVVPDDAVVAVRAGQDVRAECRGIAVADAACRTRLAWVQSAPLRISGKVLPEDVLHRAAHGWMPAMNHAGSGSVYRGCRGRAPGVQHLFNTPRRQLLVGQHTAATAARLNV